MTKLDENDIIELMIIKEISDGFGKFGDFLGILFYIAVGIVMTLVGFTLLIGGLSSLAHALFAQ